MTSETHKVDDFKVGELYFMIWHADDAKKYLVPDSVVFVGKNLESGQATEDAWYFQDTDSFCARGAYSGTTPLNATDEQPETRLYRLRYEELSQIVDSVSLAEELARCSARRAQATP
jgi:hypothetical protein